MVGYREVPVDGASFIETQDGDDLLTRGRFWIDPTNGRVVRSELIAGDARVERTARITVGYRLFPALNLWLPAQMHEVYETTDTTSHSTTITGTATYSHYRVPPSGVASLTVDWDPSLDASVVGYVVEWGEMSGVYSNAVDVRNVTVLTVHRAPDFLRRGRHVVRYRATVSRWALRFEACCVRRYGDNVLDCEICHGRIHKV